MIRVIIADDSFVYRDYLKKLLLSTGIMSVVAVVNDGSHVLRAAAHKKVNIILMDIDMPNMDGVEATREIMRSHSIPIIIMVESESKTEKQKAFNALAAGAVAITDKPSPDGSQSKISEDKFLETVRLMSEVPVITRHYEKRANATELPPKTPDVPAIAIGASTGGPQTLQIILNGIAPSLPAALLIVQHISPGYIKSMVEWLRQTTSFPVKLAEQGELIQIGCAYFAPDNYQFGIDHNGNIKLSDSPAENGLKPSVSYLFRSVRQAYGAKAIGILLTGMGVDGADELKKIKTAGGFTIVQDKDTSIVYGMPGEAVALNAVISILPPEQIAQMLPGLINSKFKDREMDK